MTPVTRSNHGHNISTNASTNNATLHPTAPEASTELVPQHPASTTVLTDFSSMTSSKSSEGTSTTSLPPSTIESSSNSMIKEVSPPLQASALPTTLPATRGKAKKPAVPRKSKKEPTRLSSRLKSTGKKQGTVPKSLTIIEYTAPSTLQSRSKSKPVMPPLSDRFSSPLGDNVSSIEKASSCGQSRLDTIRNKSGGRLGKGTVVSLNDSDITETDMSVMAIESGSDNNKGTACLIDSKKRRAAEDPIPSPSPLIPTPMSHIPSLTFSSPRHAPKKLRVVKLNVRSEPEAMVAACKESKQLKNKAMANVPSTTSLPPFVAPTALKKKAGIEGSRSYKRFHTSSEVIDSDISSGENLRGYEADTDMNQGPFDHISRNNVRKNDRDDGGKDSVDDGYHKSHLNTNNHVGYLNNDNHHSYLNNDNSEGYSSVNEKDHETDKNDEVYNIDEANSNVDEMGNYQANIYESNGADDYNGCNAEGTIETDSERASRAYRGARIYRPGITPYDVEAGRTLQRIIPYENYLQQQSQKNLPRLRELSFFQPQDSSQPPQNQCLYSDQPYKQDCSAAQHLSPYPQHHSPRSLHPHEQHKHHNQNNNRHHPYYQSHRRIKQHHFNTNDLNKYSLGNNQRHLQGSHSQCSHQQESNQYPQSQQQEHQWQIQSGYQQPQQQIYSNQQQQVYSSQQQQTHTHQQQHTYSSQHHQNDTSQQQPQQYTYSNNQQQQQIYSAQQQSMLREYFHYSPQQNTSSIASNHHPLRAINSSDPNLTHCPPPISRTYSPSDDSQALLEVYDLFHSLQEDIRLLAINQGYPTSQLIARSVHWLTRHNSQLQNALQIHFHQFFILLLQFGHYLVQDFDQTWSRRLYPWTIRLADFYSQFHPQSQEQLNPQYLRQLHFQNQHWLQDLSEPYSQRHFMFQDQLQLHTQSPQAVPMLPSSSTTAYTNTVATPTPPALENLNKLPAGYVLPSPSMKSEHLTIIPTPSSSFTTLPSSPMTFRSQQFHRLQHMRHIQDVQRHRRPRQHQLSQSHE
ncbi:hypothetical protein FBU30_001376 [Linnemannia zychae]|nr:hypothetical protein FBU30_001376 [Linnemannia zychae]